MASWLCSPPRWPWAFWVRLLAVILRFEFRLFYGYHSCRLAWSTVAMNLSPYQVTVESGRHIIPKKQDMCIWRGGQNHSISISKDRGIYNWQAYLDWGQDFGRESLGPHFQQWAWSIFQSWELFSPEWNHHRSSSPTDTLSGSSQSIKCVQPQDASGQVYANLEIPPEQGILNSDILLLNLGEY